LAGSHICVGFALSVHGSCHDAQLLTIKEIETEIAENWFIISKDCNDQRFVRRPRVIREFIERNKAELDRHGSLPCHVANPGTQGGGRPTAEYWLNACSMRHIRWPPALPRYGDSWQGAGMPQSRGLLQKTRSLGDGRHGKGCIYGMRPVLARTCQLLA
jgi:hypothetical protein